MHIHVTQKKKKKEIKYNYVLWTQKFVIIVTKDKEGLIIIIFYTWIMLN